MLGGAAGALALLLAGCASGNGAENGGGTTAPVDTPLPTASTPAGTATATVYFTVDTRAGLRLAREQRDVPADDPATGAVEAMIAGPDDPDYATTWNPETQVLAVERGDEAITVDLSEEARTANVGSPGAALMIQQLVYTVTEAIDESAPVQLLIEGEPAGELWGAVSWDEPVAREDPVDVRTFVQIDTPREGAEVTSPVTVTGDANAFEANVPWRVLDEGGQEVEAGFATTTAGQEFAPFSFTVELEPGTYTVEISEDDPSDGAGGTPMVDTKTITVS
jgi:hypothetical protein